jgi:anti-anti-sigma factor
MAVEICSRDGLSTVVVRGELDLALVPEVRAAAEKTFERPEEPLVLDLRELTFIDSSGLGYLVELHNRAHAAGRAFSLANVPLVAARTISLGGLASLLGVEPVS